MTDPLRTALEDSVRDRYDVVRRLGSGGMGAVYLARDRSLERLVAIKVLPPEVSLSEQRRERFRREARTAAKLTHPNIVPLYAVGEVDGLAYHVMGYVRGESLGERLRREGRVAPEVARRILADSAEALDYAHRQGIVHRDIKPDNILIDDESGRPMLADFGIAKGELGGESLTQPGAAIGTVRYMSPEQASGQRDIDGRSDIYALGVVGYEMLTGQLPFSGNNVHEIIAQQITTEPPPLKMLAPTVPEELAAAIGRCLARDRERRWSDGRCLKEALGSDDAVPDALPYVLEDQFPSFGSFAALWAAICGLIFAVASRSTGDVVLITLLGLSIPASFLVHAWNAHRKGFRYGQIFRVAFWPPKWWGLWWPRSLRRPGDFWDRLGWPARAVRIVVMCFFIAATAMIFASNSSSLDSMQVAAIVVLAATITAGAWWAWRQGCEWDDLPRVLIGPTAPSPFWTADHVAPVLTPDPTRLATASQSSPATPREYLRAIVELARELAGPAHQLGSRAVDAARQLHTEIEALDADISKLARAANSEALARIEEQLLALGEESTNERSEQREYRANLTKQLELTRRMNASAADLAANRARSYDILKSVREQMLALRSPNASSEDVRRDAADRLRGICGAIEREAGLRPEQPAPPRRTDPGLEQPGPRD